MTRARTVVPCPSCDGLKSPEAARCRACAQKAVAAGAASRARLEMAERVRRFEELRGWGFTVLAALADLGWSPAAAARWFYREGDTRMGSRIEREAAAADGGLPARDGREAAAARADVLAWLAAA